MNVSLTNNWVFEEGRGIFRRRPLFARPISARQFRFACGRESRADLFAPTKGFLGLCWFSALRIIRGLGRGINGVVDKKDRNTSSDRLLFVYVSFVLSQRHGGDYVFVAKVRFLENTKLQKLPSIHTDRSIYKSNLFLWNEKN